MNMHNPPHPGEVLNELCIKPVGASITDTAKALGVSRKTLSSIVNGRSGISPEMAIRLSIAFDTSAESWLHQQSQYDLWLAEQHRDELQVQKLVAA
ncbi:MAG: addiction module antidote protein, HigA family [Gammaproteobacteria bacterium]|nr:MAG: addiction module antidote protein, HigA family [Gammaproteobacteria bacterium]